MNFTNKVNIPQCNVKDQFSLYSKVNVNKCLTYRNALEGNYKSNNVSELYFSKENIQYIQNMMRLTIYNSSNKKHMIANQDCNNLKMIMRAFYLQYAVNNEANTKEQVAELNTMVINWCVRELKSEINAYLYYIKQINNPIMPFAHPVMSKDNDKQLELKHFF